MWLCRGLKFTSMGLRFNLTNKSEELSVSFTKAYEQTLKKYHGMMVRPIFYVRCLRDVLDPLDGSSSSYPELRLIARSSP